MAAPASAGSWADALFEELSKDFGSVPRGPTLSHSFQLTNNTQSTVHIARVRVSCGCVSASALKDELAPGESTAIQAQMDTRRFHGVKGVTVFVRFDRPRWEETRLWVQANSRDDVSVNPDEIAFGQVKQGSTPQASITVTFLGGARSRITEVERESNYVQTSIKELSRDGREVNYQLTATIRADTPVGKWYTDIWLKTNDPSMPKVRVPLTVQIEAALSLSPSTIRLGEVKQGTEAKRKLIVRGVRPFRITKVQGVDDQLSVQDNTSESKAVHVLTVQVKPAKAGNLHRKVKLITDLKEQGEIEFEAKAQVVQ